MGELERHDYEPGDGPVNPMQTDPQCRICGKNKNDPIHK